MTQDYSIHTDVKYGPLELVDAGALADECREKWWNQSLCRVNDCVVRIGVFEGEFHWHKHDREDEFFYVVEGRLFVDLEGRTFELAPRQGRAGAARRRPPHARAVAHRRADDRGRDGEADRRLNVMARDQPSTRSSLGWPFGFPPPSSWPPFCLSG